MSKVLVSSSLLSGGVGNGRGTGGVAEGGDQKTNDPVVTHLITAVAF